MISDHLYYGRAVASTLCMCDASEGKVSGALFVETEPYGASMLRDL